MREQNNTNYLMSIDLGTSTLKVAIFDILGKVASFKSLEYPLSYHGKDIVENDVEKYWQSITSLVRGALKEQETTLQTYWQCLFLARGRPWCRWIKT